jgi:hypothetical protein
VDGGLEGLGVDVRSVVRHLYSPANRGDEINQLK